MRRCSPFLGHFMQRKALYFGLDPSRYAYSGTLVHYPLIKIIPRPLNTSLYNRFWQDLGLFDLCILTSRTAALLLYPHLPAQLQLLCIGKATASLIPRECFIAAEETQEGIMQMLPSLHPQYVLYMHSSLARKELLFFLQKEKMRHFAAPLYDTELQAPSSKLDLEAFDALVFTSPSTVDAFVQFFGAIPQTKEIRAIGPITKKRLLQLGVSVISSE